jgi:hypothetical protein
VNPGCNCFDRQRRLISHPRRYRQPGRVAFGSQSQIALLPPNPLQFLGYDTLRFGLSRLLVQLAGMVLAELAVNLLQQLSLEESGAVGSIDTADFKVTPY